MKGEIEVLFFSGKRERCVVDLRVAGRISFAPDSSATPSRTVPSAVSKAATSLAVQAVARLLEDAAGSGEWRNPSFRLESLELETLSSCNGSPDSFHLAQLLGVVMLSSMLSYVDEGYTEAEEPFQCRARDADELYESLRVKFSQKIKENSTKLRYSFLAKRPSEPHPVLGRAEAIEKDGDPRQAFELIQTLDPSQLDPSDRGRLSVLKLKLLTRMDLTDPGYHANLEQYNELRAANHSDVEVLRKLYFIWIRYQQKRRKFKIAKEAVDEFEGRFPVSSLEEAEKAVFSYLKGHIEYHDGEYVGALELLDSAFVGADRDDREFVSDIFNTAASSFTDNLYFEQAGVMFDEALRIREDLRLAKAYETLSAKGCVALKSADYAAAEDLFLKALRGMRETGFIEDENRILNYVAKAALFKGDFDTAREYIDEAFLKAKDKKSSIAFTSSIKMAFLVEKGDYAEADVFFKEAFLLPEKHSEVFATAWGYFYEAEACRRLGREKDAVQYLARSIRFFLSELYVLEAGLASIAPLLWNLSEEERALFDRLAADLNVIPRLLEYKEAHQDLPKRFFNAFLREKCGGAGDSKPRVEAFIEGIIDSTYAGNPEQARKVFDSVCLL